MPIPRASAIPLDFDSGFATRHFAFPPINTMNIENLVKMANDIGNFFSAEPDRAAAVEGVTDHLHRFWEPRMRSVIVAHYRAGGIGLGEIARAAVARLAGEEDAIRQTGAG